MANVEETSRPLIRGLDPIIWNILVLYCPHRYNFSCGEFNLKGKSRFGRNMTKSKADWNEISSIEGLGVDWEYEPENPLGKREMVRVASKDLRTILGVKKIPVKVVGKNGESTGYLADIATNGIAVLLDRDFTEGQPVKLGLFLGKQKVLSRAIVRSVMQQDGGWRTGMEFVDIEEEYRAHIDGLISSKVYKSL